MKPISIGITAMALFLVVAAGATAHYVYETRLSSGYTPILRAAMTSSYEERTAYIHEARVAVRTNKDREVEAKLEKMQGDLSDDMPPACKNLQYITEDKQEKFNRAVVANQRGEPAAYAVPSPPVPSRPTMQSVPASTLIRRPSGRKVAVLMGDN
jgi:hypothetical protein